MRPIFRANGETYVQRSPRYNHKPIPLENVGSPDKFKKQGDFCWGECAADRDPRHRAPVAKGTRVFIVAIPCLNTRGWVHSEWTIGFKNESDSQWAWDGNEDMPTLTPSLHAVGIWHGSVTEGELVEASGL